MKAPESDTRPADCQAMLERVSAYIDGELGEVECHAIEAHGRSCPKCAALIDSLRHTVGLCREAGGRPLPDTVRQLAKDRIAELIARPKRTP